MENAASLGCVLLDYLNWDAFTKLREAELMHAVILYLRSHFA